MGRALLAAVAEALRDAGVGRGDRVLVAVSGGVDSMVLLHTLVRLRPRFDLWLHVAHVHHGLRGRSADRDAALVAAEAARYGLSVSVERLAPETRPRGTSVQVWAREARYARLESIRRRIRASRILTAHTQNDQAETVLLNLLRGTGPRGLAGIPGVRERILRPLLGVSRAAIERYAAAHGVRFREDPSNRSVAYRRNRIRTQLLPLLARDYNPRIVQSLAGLATQAREDEEALTSQAQALAAGALHMQGRSVGVSLALLGAAPPAAVRRVLQEAFRRASAERHGLTRRHVLALCRLGARGGGVPLPGGLQAWRSGRCLWIGTAVPGGDAHPTENGSPGPEARGAVAVRPGAWTRWEPGACSIRVHRVAGRGIRVSRGDGRREFLSPSVLEQPLLLRSWRPGDRFQPLGLRGWKKLQDFFVDAKVPREDRTRVALLVAGERIAWVVGHRIAEEFRWNGQASACLAEVRFSEDRDGLSTGSDVAVGS